MLRDVLIQKGLSNRESEVAELVTKGMSNNDIADHLISQGYSAIQASEALNKADISRDIDDVPVPAAPSGEMRASAMDNISGHSQQETPQFEHHTPEPEQFNYAPSQPQSVSFEPRNDLVEEIAESVVNEKWKHFIANF